jgi:hypothetical protein
MVDFPANKFDNIPSLCRTYIFDLETNKIELYIINGSEKIIHKTIQACKNNIRLLILQDIFLKTASLGLSKELIILKNTDHLFKILIVPQTPDEKHQEQLLCQAFLDLLAGNIVINSNIEGYQQLVSCLETGGF